MAQVVAAQGFLDFRQAQFPRRTGVVDGRYGRCTGAAVVTRHGDQVGIGLYDARGDGADAGMRDQLHRYQRGRIYFLQVIDELGQVFDRIDVVVRWRRDQADAGLGIAQPCDQFVDLVAGKLAAFAGLGTLRDLDLQYFGVHQVFGCHTKPSGGNLFDFGRFFRVVSGRVFAAFTGIGARAEPIHRDGERFVRFGRQRAQRHASRIKSRKNFRGRLHLRQRNWHEVGPQAQQVAQRAGRSTIHVVGIRLVVGGIAAAYRALQAGDHIRVVHVVLAAMHVLQPAPGLDALGIRPGALRKLASVVLQVGEGRALDAAGDAGKAKRHDLIGQANDFKKLRPAVTADGADAHLRQDLQQAFLQAASIAAAQFHRLVATLAFQRAAAAQRRQGLVGEVGIDGGRADADQAGDLVRVARSAGFDQQVAIATQADVHQVVVDRAGGEQGMDGQAAGLGVAVRQQQQDVACAHGGFGFGAKPL